MIASRLVLTLSAAALFCLAHSPDVRAQAQPSPAAVALAREIVELKGATTMFDGVIVGAVEYHKQVLLQANPNLSKDLTDVANRLIKEFEPRRVELQLEVARAYASRFTEPELKEIVAFYKTPLGRKIIAEEPRGIDEASKRADVWASKYGEEVLTRIRAEMKKRGFNV